MKFEERIENCLKEIGNQGLIQAGPLIKGSMGVNYWSIPMYDKDGNEIKENISVYHGKTYGIAPTEPLHEVKDLQSLLEDVQLEIEKRLTISPEEIKSYGYNKRFPKMFNFGQLIYQEDFAEITVTDKTSEELKLINGHPESELAKSLQQDCSRVNSYEDRQSVKFIKFEVGLVLYPSSEILNSVFPKSYMPKKEFEKFKPSIISRIFG